MPCEKSSSRVNLYFDSIHEKLLCRSNYKWQTVGYKINLNQTNEIINTIKATFLNQTIQKIMIKFFTLENSIMTKFEAEIEFRLSSKVSISTHAFTFKFGNKITYRVLFAFLLAYLAYFGYEKLCEVWKSEFGSSQRLLVNVLDLSSFFLAFMSLIYINEFSIYDQTSFTVGKPSL